jgi:hypothetical protein
MTEINWDAGKKKATPTQVGQIRGLRTAMSNLQRFHEGEKAMTRSDVRSAVYTIDTLAPQLAKILPGLLDALEEPVYTWQT